MVILKRIFHNRDQYQALFMLEGLYFQFKYMTILILSCFRQEIFSELQTVTVTLTYNSDSPSFAYKYCILSLKNQKPFKFALLMF